MRQAAGLCLDIVIPLQTDITQQNKLDTIQTTVHKIIKSIVHNKKHRSANSLIYGCDRVMNVERRPLNARSLTFKSKTNIIIRDGMELLSIHIFFERMLQIFL